MWRNVFLLLIDYCLITNAVGVVSKANKQVCTEKCTFKIGFDDIGKWPKDECNAQSSKDVCKVTIQYTYGSTLPAVVTFDPFDIGTDPSTQMPDNAAEVLNEISSYTFWQPEVEPTFEVSFKCSTDENDCDKAYITKNWAAIQNSFQPNATYYQLYPLLYHIPSTVSQCFTSADASQNCSGYCQYTLDTSQYYTCMSAVASGTPAIVTYTKQRIQSGPMKSNYDKLNLMCNVNKCNGPDTLSQMRKIFGITDPTSSAIMNSSIKFLILLFPTLLCFHKY
jgi:hypothetical protein